MEKETCYGDENTTVLYNFFPRFIDVEGTLLR